MRRVAGIGVFLLLLPVIASPAGSAADRTPPKIVKAAMGDADHDGKADRVVVTYTERVSHALDADGHYPFKVQNYVVKSVGGAASAKTLVLTLKEKAAPDGNARPSVTYARTQARPVRDGAGNEAANQTFAGTFPVLGVFVALTGDDVNPGTQSSPLRHVQAGVEKASTVGAQNVFVA